MTPAPSRILAIKLADIGDLLLVTPALQALRQAYPNAILDVLVTPRSASAYQNIPFIDNLIPFDKYPFDYPLQALRSGRWGDLIRLGGALRARRYDTVLLFHHLSLRFGALKHALLMLATGAPARIGLDNGRGWFLTKRIPDPNFGAQHEVDLWLDLAVAAGAAPGRRPVAIGITTAEQERAATLLPPDRHPMIAIHPGSGGYSLARRWEITKFAELAGQLGQQAQVVIVGTPADGTDELAPRLNDNILNLGGRTTIPELAAVLARCDLLIGADSGVLHVGAAVGTPTVALFGPSNHRAWAPLLPAEKLAIVRAGSACSPCAYTRHGLGAPAGCPQRSCMALISVEQVRTTAERLLTGKVGPAPASPLQPPNRPPSYPILNVPLHAITFADLLDQIDSLLASGRPHQIATVNPEFVMAAQRDPIFQIVLERATLCLPDGVGLLWAARWLYRGRGSVGSPLPERVTGSDGVPLIAERAAEKGWRLFLLGAAPGIAKETARLLTQRYPGLEIAGTYAGSPAAEEEETIIKLVNQARSDILLVAYGAPKQDKWIARNLPALQVGVAMGVGGAFDFITGKTRRAPVWMRRLGLEWLHRLLCEPWRWRRMLALPRFAVKVFWAGLKRKRTS